MNSLSLAARVNKSPIEMSQCQSKANSDLRVKLLVNSDVLSDISFVVGRKASIIHAHRFPLVAASDVFYQMFTEKATPVSCADPIEVADIEPDIFLEMLKFIYCDDPAIREDNLVELYYAANKYNLTLLKNRCQQFISKEEASVLKILTANVKYGFEVVNEACLKCVCRNPLVVFRSLDFLELRLELVEKIVSRNKLRCNDDQLLDAIRKWCKHQQETTNQTAYLQKLYEIVRRKQEQSRDYLCRKWLFFGSICYTIDSCKGTFHITAYKAIYLFGVGLHIGCQENELPMSISVMVMIDDKIIRRCQRNVPVREDIYVYDCMFERVSLTEGSKMTIVCDGPKITGGSLKKFTFWRRGFTWTGDSTVMKVEDDKSYEHTAIAYILYQTKTHDDCL